MKKTNSASNGMPVANLAINKSRLKLYDKNVDMPTYYLQKKQEFQIELFNPTQSVILAKITLNNKLISQGGLVLKPGQRVFLDRYLDVAKKFLFDTYEVSNSKETKKAIESNGDLKVEFYRENEQIINFNPSTSTTYLNGTTPAPSTYLNKLTYTGTQPNYLRTNTSGSIINTSSSGSIMNTSSVGNATTYTSCLDSLSFLDDSIMLDNQAKSFSKTIETGRIEQGSNSSQEFKTVNKSFEYFPFWSIQYKLLPISQKINTLEDINVKVYCTNCAHKLKNGYKYCPICATKV
jgi:hypothetical protein